MLTGSMARLGRDPKSLITGLQLVASFSISSSQHRGWEQERGDLYFIFFPISKKKDAGPKGLGGGLPDGSVIASAAAHFPFRGAFVFWFFLIL